MMMFLAGAASVLLLEIVLVWKIARAARNDLKKWREEYDRYQGPLY